MYRKSQPLSHIAPSEREPRRRWLPRWVIFLPILIPMAFSPASLAQANTVTVPLRIDYPLLQQLMIMQMFTGTGASRELLNDPSGCSEIFLREPLLASTESKLELLANLSARIGVGAKGSCATMLSWEGRIGISGSPEIRNDGTALGFAPERVWLMDPGGQPLVNNQLQALADSSVRAIFSRFTVDLVPQLQSIGDFLPAVLPRHSQAQIAALISTLRVSNLQAADDALHVDIDFTVEPLTASLPPEHALSDEEIARWEERWQLMDSLLVLAVKHYAASTQLQSLRDALLEVLIESRYRLQDALAETPQSSGDQDLVREWFLQSWQALAPVIRTIGVEQPGQEHLLLISVIAATDALTALDQLGPSVGLDISADGLRRLARMINGSAGDDLLQYSEDLDPQLRKLLDDSFDGVSPPSAWHWDFSFFPKAVAANDSRLNSWAPQTPELAEYLPLVGGLLQTSAEKAIASRKLNAEYQQLFRRLVLTTAWQESCWRHYVVSKEKKLVPIRSGTGDVGLMQINERVWRGFYDQQRLRWDIEYNGAAGAEVLIDYLMKYAIRSGEHKQPGGVSNLARASYSAYNGGPSQVARYRSSKASAYGKKVDAAFWDKYQQVAAGNELGVSNCLGGDLSGPLAVKRPTAASPAGEFTLQLGAFSSIAAAQAFVKQHKLDSKASVRQRRKGDTGQYLVVYGNYTTRAQAENAKKTMVKFQPWIRPVADL